MKGRETVEEGKVSHPLPSGKGNESESSHKELLQVAAWACSCSSGGSGVVLCRGLPPIHRYMGSTGDELAMVA